MLPKLSRLNLKTDFKWVASGKKLETKYLKLFLRTGENNYPRIGIAVSSKNFKTATARNRAKRLTSQAFQVSYNQLPSSVNIIALPKQGVIEVKSGELVNDLKSVLKKI